MKHHENGSIKIKLEPNVVDRVNICRCHPYYSMPEQDEQNPDANTQQAMNETLPMQQFFTNIQINIHK